MNKVKKRFEEKFIKLGGNDCWNWQASKHLQGYGWFRFAGKMQMAHRISFLIYRGEFPEHLKVLHKCDNPACVNPFHLFLGTDMDNTKDKINKGRANTLTGVNCYQASLTMARVRRIREFSSVGIRNYELVPTFGVSKLIISRIIKNKIYKEAPIEKIK